MNVLAQLGHRESGLIDPWDFQDPAANPPSPCRTIPITDEIRARDAADRAAREVRPDWAIKASLSQDNLHLVRRFPVGPLRREDRPRIVAPRRVGRPRSAETPKPARPRPTCACGGFLNYGSTATACWKCLKLAAQRKCMFCPAVLRKNKQGDVCTKCQDQARPPRRKPGPAPRPVVPAVERRCACGRRLRPSNPRDTCFECAGLILNKEERLARRVKCATPECKRLLRFPRTAGVCGVCMDRTSQRKETVDRYRQKKMAEAGKTCKVCGVPIKWTTKTECCIKHAAQLRSNRVILHAATREEHELNVLWASLSLEDKWAVLEEAMQGRNPQPQRLLESTP